MKTDDQIKADIKKISDSFGFYYAKPFAATEDNLVWRGLVEDDYFDAVTFCREIKNLSEKKPKFEDSTIATVRAMYFHTKKEQRNERRGFCPMCGTSGKVYLLNVGNTILDYRKIDPDADYCIGVADCPVCRHEKYNPQTAQYLANVCFPLDVKPENPFFPPEWDTRVSSWGGDKVARYWVGKYQEINAGKAPKAGDLL